MNKEMMQHYKKTIVIPKEDAVFWMDGNGRWWNRHGLFGHRGIIDHFNRSIRHDDSGFFVAQVRDGILEKVYFRCEDTAIFALDLLSESTFKLVLNTGKRIDLEPGRLMICNDRLYQREKQYPVKFSERAMMTISGYLSEAGSGYHLSIGGDRYAIPEFGTLPASH
jgi:hypothetical protein